MTEGADDEGQRAPTVPTVPTAPTADDEYVVELWRSLGLPGLMDLHVHFMPHRVMEAVWAFFDDAARHYGRTWPVAYREAAEARLARLRGWGVRVFPSLLYPHKPGMAEGLNDWAGSFAGDHPDVLHTATFFAEPAAARYVADALAAGAVVVKAHLQVGGYDPRDAQLDDVWGQLAEAGTLAVVHCGSGPVPGRFTGPGPFGEVLARHPGLRVVIAHLGAPEFEDFLDLAEARDEVYLDTAMAFTPFFNRIHPFPERAIPRLRSLQHKIVLGSDFPNTPYTYATQLRALDGLGLGPDWMRAVLWDNPARLVARLPVA